MLLNTERLIIRDISLNDVADLFEYANLDDFGQNAGWPPHRNLGDSIRVITRFMETKDVFAIVENNTNKMVGTIGIHQRIPFKEMERYSQCEIAGCINPRYWRKGYFSECFDICTKYCFEELNVQLVWVCFQAQNYKTEGFVKKNQMIFYKSREEMVTQLKKTKVLYYYYYDKERYYASRLRRDTE